MRWPPIQVAPISMQPDAKPSPLSWCPKSGQLLGAVVAAFRLDDPAVGGLLAARNLDRSTRPTKGFFAGEWVGDEQRRQVCGWVADALVNSGLLGGLRFAMTEAGVEPPSGPIFAETIHAWLRWWDAEFHVAADRWPGADRAMASVVLARPVAVDLALRWTSALVLTGSSAPTDNPRWSEPGGPARILRAAIDEHFPDHTLDEYAAAFQVNRRTVDRWLSPTEQEVPTESNISGIAAALSRASGEPVAGIRARLLREYGMFVLTRDLAATIGWHWASELGVGLVRFVQFAIEDFGAEQPTREFLENHSLSLMNGIGLPANAFVVNEWLGRKLAPFWSDDVRAARDGMIGERLTQCLRVVGRWSVDGPPPLPDDYARTPEERRKLLESIAIMAMNDNRATPEQLAHAAKQGQVFYRIPAADDATRIANRTMQAEACMAVRDFKGAVPHLARIVELSPADPKARFFYGAALWQAGEFDRAADELRESVRLKPDWDRPFVEIAIVWLNRGMSDQALFHLQSEGVRFREVSDHFNATEGIALRLLGKLDEALIAFERATALNPQHALAFDLAADCAFRLLDKIKGRRYAKSALDLGRDKSYRRYCT